MKKKRFFTMIAMSFFFVLMVSCGKDKVDTEDPSFFSSVSYSEIASLYGIPIDQAVAILEGRGFVRSNPGSDYYSFYKTIDGSDGDDRIRYELRADWGMDEDGEDVQLVKYVQYYWSLEGNSLEYKKMPFADFKKLLLRLLSEEYAFWTSKGYVTNSGGIEGDYGYDDVTGTVDLGQNRATFIEIFSSDAITAHNSQWFAETSYGKFRNGRFHSDIDSYIGMIWECEWECLGNFDVTIGF